MLRFIVGLAVGSVAIGSIACADAPAPEPLVEIRDSSGIRIVDNSWQQGEWATISTEPALAIGAVEGSEPLLFSDVTTALGLPSGGVLVVDEPSREIRLFSDSGEHVRSLSGRGGGPGEFQSVPVVTLAGSDTILAWDEIEQRISWFTTSGRLVREKTLERKSGHLRASRWEWVANLWLVGQRSTPSNAVGNLQQEPVSLLIIELGSEDVTHLEGLPGQPNVTVGRTGISGLFHPTAGAGNWAGNHNPPSLIVADNPDGRWELSVYDMDGTKTSSIRATVTRRALDDDLVERARQWLRTRGSQPDFLKAVEMMPIPDKAPATLGIMADADGRVWVRRWRPPWERSEGSDHYDVIDADGRWLGSVDIPRRLGTVLSIGEDYVLFEWRDDMSVPHVRKHLLQRR